MTLLFMVTVAGEAARGARRASGGALASVVAAMILTGCAAPESRPPQLNQVALTQAAAMMPPAAMVPQKIFYCTNCPAKPIGGEWDGYQVPASNVVRIVHEVELSNGEVLVTASTGLPGPHTYTLMKNTGGDWYPVISNDFPESTPQTTAFSAGLLLVDDTMTNQNAMYTVRAQ